MCSILLDCLRISLLALVFLKTVENNAISLAILFALNQKSLINNVKCLYVNAILSNIKFIIRKNIIYVCLLIICLSIHLSVSKILQGLCYLGRKSLGGSTLKQGPGWEHPRMLWLT